MLNCRSAETSKKELSALPEFFIWQVYACHGHFYITYFRKCLEIWFQNILPAYRVSLCNECWYKEGSLYHKKIFFLPFVVFTVLYL